MVRIFPLEQPFTNSGISSSLITGGSHSPRYEPTFSDGGPVQRLVAGHDVQLALPAQLAPVELMLFGPLGWDGMFLGDCGIGSVFYHILSNI